MTLSVQIPPVSHVEGSRAWLLDRLMNRCTLHAEVITDNEFYEVSHLLRLELRWERDGKTHRRVLTILDTDGDVQDDRYEGMGCLSAACLKDLRDATKGLLASLKSAADTTPVRLVVER